MTKEQIVKALYSRKQWWANDHYYKTFLASFLDAFDAGDVDLLEELSRRISMSDLYLLDKTTWPIGKDSK